MPKTSKFWEDPKNRPLVKLIERDFKSYEVMVHLSRKTFQDENFNAKDGRISKKILLLLAEKGPLNEIDIFKHLNDENKAIAKWQIQYRITNNKKKRKKNLLESGYLNQKSGKSRGYLKPKTYSLTLKGFLWSLSEISFEKSYMVNKYWEILHYHCGEIKYFDVLIMLAIKYNIVMFLFDTYINHVNLAEFYGLEDVIGYFNNVNPYKLSLAIRGIQLSKKDKELLSEIRYRYMLTASIPYVISGKRISESEELEGLWSFEIREWYRHIEGAARATRYKNLRGGPLHDYKSTQYDLPDIDEDVTDEIFHILDELKIKPEGGQALVWGN